jgi:hypothetical protein
MPPDRRPTTNLEMTDMARLWVSNATRRLVLVVMAIGLAAGSAAPASTLTVPYTETFATGDANWRILSGGPAELPTWVQSGGPGNANYISQQYLVPTTGGGFSGPTLFRGQGNLDSSDDRFVGNWITGGVGQFGVALRHSAPESVIFQFRFAPTANSPGASTIDHVVPSNTWTTITVPIVDSASVFQAYSQFTPPNPAVFSDIFGDLSNIQIGLAPLARQDASILGQTWSFDLAAPSISAVPEPAAWVTLAAAAAAAAAVRLRRLRGRHAA